MNIISVIPAREGSKGLPNKNILDLDGQSLIAYSIVDSLRSKHIEETFVSTDSLEIGKIAEKYGAEVPFARPKKYAKDDSKDIEWVRHFLCWFKLIYDKLPEYIVHLRPTTPLREVDMIDKAIETIIDNPDATALRSVHKTIESPYKTFSLEKGYLKGMFPDYPIKEYYNLPRQHFPQTYKPNGYVDILKTSTILGNSLHGDKILTFETSHTVEVDSKEEFEYLEYLINKMD